MLNTLHKDIALFPIFYFPPISWWAAMVECLKNDIHILLEVQENFPKQTYRNRMEIYGANGLLVLSIPIQKSDTSRKYAATQVCNRENWQMIHWKSLEYAYRASPYFEFYENKLKSVFFSNQKSLLTFNLEMITVIAEFLSIKIPFTTTTSYTLGCDLHSGALDYRDYFSAKEKLHWGKPYTQVFGEKFGFLPNLSILDLLFCKGPQAKDYLNQ